MVVGWVGVVEAGGGKRKGDQNPAGVLQQHVMCQHGSVPEHTGVSAAWKYTVSFQQGYSDVDLSSSFLNRAVNSLQP